MKMVWLSHVLSESTPLYGGHEKIIIRTQRSLEANDSCNTSTLTLSSHAGTHVDAPFHFLSNGKTVDCFPPDTWVFTSSRLIDVSVEPGQLITADLLPSDMAGESSVEIVLIRTGFERFRYENIYWQRSPGLSSELADYLRNLYPNLRAVGLDCISISSLQHRDHGRVAHKKFLGYEMLLFEDMALGYLSRDVMFERIVALPLRFKMGDGAPCTVVGWIAG